MIQEKDLQTTRPMGDNFFHILSILIIFRCNFSFATYIPQYSSTIQLGLFAIWYVMAVFKHKDMFHQTIKVCWPLIIFLCINITIDDIFMTGWSVITKNYILVFIVFSVYLAYSLEKDSKYKKIMIAMILIEFVFVSFNTMKELATNPLYSRMLASSTEDVDYKGVAGYGHIYSYMIMICSFVAILFTKQIKTTYKTGLILLISLGTVLLFSASYLIAIVVVIAQIIYCILIKNTKRSPVKTIIVIAVITLFVILFDTIFNGIYNMIDSELIREKLDDISRFFAGESASQTDGRLERMMISIETFFDNFFLGLYGTGKLGYVGNHSGLFDLLAQFGAIRGGLFITFMILAYRYILGQFENTEYQKIIKNIFLIALVFSVINPFVFQQFFVSLFITVPFIAELVFMNKKNI